MNQSVVAKAIILDDEGRVLLLRRSRTDEGRPGEWDYPGGGIEAGEGVSAGVIREIGEEAGLHIDMNELKLVYAATEPWPPEDISITRLVFVAKKPADQTVKLSFEHEEYHWVSVETALKDFKHFFYNPALKYANDHSLLV